MSRVKDLVARERAVTLEILVHLIEVERRRLHLGLGYASMFEYATRRLGYSESAAARRIRVARCIRDYPEVRRFLEKNEGSLVTISMVASILTKANARDVVAKIRGKSQREVEAIVATYRPPVSMRDRVTPVCVAVPEGGISQLIEKKIDRTATGGSTAGGSAAGQCQVCSESQAQRQASTQPTVDHPTARTPRLEAKFLIQFLASPRFMQKLERAKALLSNKNGGLSHEFVLEAALDEFLKDHDPEERNKRREERKRKAESRAESRERAASEAVGSQAEGRIGGAGGGQADGFLSSSQRAGSGSVDGPAGSSVQTGSGQADDPLFRRWIGGLPATRIPATDEGTSRRIPDAVRDAVFARDKGRCTYIASNGERCTATHHLQIDHIIPYARGGTNTLGNLRLLCERHNKLEAARVLGADVITRFCRRE